MGTIRWRVWSTWNHFEWMEPVSTVSNYSKFLFHGKLKLEVARVKHIPLTTTEHFGSLFRLCLLRFVICQSHVTFVGYSEPTFHPFAFYPLPRIVTQLAGSRLGSGSRVSSSAFVSLPNLVNEQREGGKERRRRRSLVFVEHPSAPSR